MRQTEFKCTALDLAMANNNLMSDWLRADGNNDEYYAMQRVIFELHQIIKGAAEGYIKLGGNNE